MRQYSIDHPNIRMKEVLNQDSTRVDANHEGPFGIKTKLLVQPVLLFLALCICLRSFYLICLSVLRTLCPVSSRDATQTSRTKTRIIRTSCPLKRLALCPLRAPLLPLSRSPSHAWEKKKRYKIIHCCNLMTPNEALTNTNTHFLLFCCVGEAQALHYEAVSEGHVHGRDRRNHAAQQEQTRCQRNQHFGQHQQPPPGRSRFWLLI